MVIRPAVWGASLVHAEISSLAHSDICGHAHLLVYDDARGVVVCGLSVYAM